MGWTQIIFGAVLVLVLLFVAILYIVRQIIALRRLRAAEEMPLEEHAYLYSRARRRLVTSLLMFLLGGMLVVDLLFLEVPAQQLADHQQERMQREGDVPPLDEEQRSCIWLVLHFFLDCADGRGRYGGAGLLGDASLWTSPASQNHG